MYKNNYKNKIILFVIISLVLLISCGDNSNNDINNKVIEESNPILDDISFNIDDNLYCCIGDEITYTVPGETDYSLYYAEVDNTDGINKVSDTLFVCNDVGTYHITLRNYDYPEWEYTKVVKIYQKVFTLSASTYVLPINREVDVNLSNINGLYEQTVDDFIFSSSDELIAYNTNNGTTFYTKKPGTFLIYAVSKYNSNVKSQIEIKVSDGTDFYIDPISDEKTLKVAEEREFNVSFGKPSDYIWSSSDNDIVKIIQYDTKLVVIGVSEGITNISGYFESDASIRTTYQIEVKGIMEVDYISKFIYTAFNEVGTVETGDNHQKYGVWYGNDGQPWCAMFVSWCWYHAGLSNELMVKYQGCWEGYQWSLNHGIFHYKEDYTPVTGDIIFFLSNGASHTGIVAYCDGKYVYTIEGNAANKVGIWRMSVNFNQITGYAHPNYPASTTTQSFEWIKGINPSTGNYYWTHKGSDDSTI